MVGERHRGERKTESEGEGDRETGEREREKEGE